MIRRPFIPVRDGIRPLRKPVPTFLQELGGIEYRKGFWVGYVGGFAWGALLTAILFKVVLH